MAASEDWWRAICDALARRVRDGLLLLTRDGALAEEVVCAKGGEQLAVRRAVAGPYADNAMVDEVEAFIWLVLRAERRGLKWMAKRSCEGGETVRAPSARTKAYVIGTFGLVSGRWGGTPRI